MRIVYLTAINVKRILPKLAGGAGRGCRIVMLAQLGKEGVVGVGEGEVFEKFSFDGARVVDAGDHGRDSSASRHQSQSTGRTGIALR